MNNEKKQAPRCPYCGAEMRIEKPIFANENDYDASLVGAKAGWCTQATCTKCWSVAPFVYGTETEKDAYEVVREKAMKRWQEPNRVLTLDELKTYIGYAWYEGDHKWYHSSFDYPVWIEDGKYNYEGDLYDIPDVEGRFWLRKPTKAELDAKREDEGR